MSKTVILTCDCGCGKSANGYESKHWLTLSQLPKIGTDEPKIGFPQFEEPPQRAELHFATFVCAQKWLSEALEKIPGLIKTAQQRSPRGWITDRKFPNLYV